jgi:hypothetical protein
MSFVGLKDKWLFSLKQVLCPAAVRKVAFGRGNQGQDRQDTIALTLLVEMSDPHHQVQSEFQPKNCANGPLSSYQATLPLRTKLLLHHAHLAWLDLCGSGELQRMARS